VRFNIAIDFNAPFVRLLQKSFRVPAFGFRMRDLRF